MEDQNQNSKIVGTIVALLAVVLGVGFIHENMGSPRPFSPLASQNFSDVEDFHRVESRLWQDPFESFESGSNFTAAGTLCGVTNELQKAVRQLPWDDINERRSNGPVAILAVTLPGGPYGEDKEVRLRLRYAVQVALLTQNVGPEDNTHIYTNSAWLNLPDSPEGSYKEARLSQYAYEWFSTENTTTNRQICVLWLNEDDFADNPASRFGSLMEHIPSLQDTDCCPPVSFYLIGPRGSGTLRGLADTQTNRLPADIYSTLTGAALAGHFNILSPEATAYQVNGDAEDPANVAVRKKLAGLFQRDVFHNWIATDQQVGALIAQELSSRITGPLAKETNVVVLLSEQDTYYGRRLADEWTAALVQGGVCDSNHVWQFSYLRGLDGSKPETETPAETMSSDATPAAALETAMKQQQQGERADGDAQLDYIARLADYLKKKDDKMKEEGAGRIIAFGFACSDTYDKLILLEELRDHFPEAVFFTSDLDAGLWTTQDKRYTRNLLVGSADPVNPRITEANTQPAEQEFAPFRDVYQSAVYRACYQVIQYEENGGITNLQAQANDLRGGLYKIGRHGPVRLLDSASRPSQDYAARPLLPTQSVLVGLAALTALVLYFAAGLRSGLYWGTQRISRADSWPMQRAENKEFKHQFNLFSMQGVMCVFGLVGGFLFFGAFYFLTWKIARMPGEEPWSFWEGISIWPTEYVRFLAIAGSLGFFLIIERSRRKHLKDLWKRYFAEEGTSIRSNKEWEEFYHNKQRKGAKFIRAWMPPFKDAPPGEPNRDEKWLDAGELFRCYLHLGRFFRRLRRTFVTALLYIGVLILILSLLKDIPTYLLIRGPWSHVLDREMLLLVAFFLLTVLFWVLDYSLLTKRVLEYICRHPTSWPELPRRFNAIKYGVRPADTAALVDVDFAAFQTQWAAPMMFWPIILQLLFIFARCPCFDDWTWPLGIILIFVMNFLLAIVSWWLVRRAAFKLQGNAMERVEENILSVKMSPEDSTFQVIDPRTEKEITVKKEVYLNNLESVHKAIEEERRGAFAKWFQDPSYLAIFIPSGASGIITLIATFLLKK